MSNQCRLLLVFFVFNIKTSCNTVLAAGQKTRQKCYLKSNLCQLTNIKYEMEDELQGTIKLLYTQNTVHAVLQNSRTRKEKRKKNIHGLNDMGNEIYNILNAKN